MEKQGSDNKRLNIEHTDSTSTGYRIQKKKKASEKEPSRYQLFAEDQKKISERTHSMNGKCSWIPKWIETSKCGELIDVNVSCNKKLAGFVCFKTPVGSNWDQVIKGKDKWSPRCLVGHMKEKKISLAGIIDMCNTKKYYSPRDLPKQIQHVKFEIPGKVTPGQEEIDSFAKIVLDLTNNCQNDRCWIGVHCTHGRNRTGFFVIAFLVTQCGMTLNEAIELFETKRKSKMERGYLVEGLRQIFEKVE
eukprot:GHVL01031152.1.p1 GENE.GHVL01031152.1~~GHVL01031152.1.p1  ORF type:complete len:247 (+),score=49.42 GHVL01031152.1:94-834(+)